MTRIIVFFLTTFFNAGAQDLSVEATKVDGVIEFVYQKDSATNSFFFVKNYIVARDSQVYNLMNNYSIGQQVLNLCGDRNKMIEVALDQRSKSYDLVESPLYRSKFVFNSGVHYGGNTYSRVGGDENEIIIAFEVIVYGVAIISPCPALIHPLLNQSSHCTFTESSRQFPLLLVTNVHKIKALSDFHKIKMGLSELLQTSFVVIHCE